MGRKPKSHKPSFFKVLVKDYSTILRLPPVFVKKYGKFLRESSNVRTSSRETWVVKLEERSYDDEKYWFFTKGWNLDLKFGEFLVFWFNVGDSSFDVSAYGTNCCEREIIDSNADQVFEFKSDNCHNLPDARKKPLRSCTPDQGDAGSHPRFERLLNESRISRVCIPKVFAEASGIIGQRAVVLEYPPKQQFWSVVLDQRVRQRHGFSLDLASGWSNFRKDNSLVMGKTYSFEFDPSR